MKSRNLGLTVLTVFLFASIVTTSLGEKPLSKLVIHEVWEEPFNGGWAKVVMGGTMIVKDYDGEYYDVTTHMIQKLLIYDSEGGNLQAVVSINLNYVGTVTDIEGNDDPTENMWTGVMTATLIVNWFVSETPPMEDSHWVVWYEEGNVVKSIGFGEMP